MKSLSHVWLFATPWTVAYQAPLSMEFSRQNTGVDCHFLLQGIFPTQGSNPGLLHCRQTLCHLSHQVSPKIINGVLNNNWNWLNWMKAMIQYQYKDIPSVITRKQTITKKKDNKVNEIGRLESIHMIILCWKLLQQTQESADPARYTLCQLDDTFLQKFSLYFHLSLFPSTIILPYEKYLSLLHRYYQSNHFILLCL